MRRPGLYTAMVLLGTGVGSWYGYAAGQGVIARSQPVAAAARPTVLTPDQSPPVSLDEAAPPIPRLPTTAPVVPVPDDGLGSAIRHLRPRPLRPIDSGREDRPAGAPAVIVPAVIMAPTHPAPAVQAPASPAPIERTVFTVPAAPVKEAAARVPPRDTELAEPASPGNVAASDGAAGPQAANVSIEVVGQQAVRRGQAFGYEIVVRNGGPATAYQVRVEEIISAQARYVSVAPTPSMQRGQMVWEVGTLAAGAERRIRLQVEPVGEAEIVSLARATFSVSSGLRTRVSKPEVRVAAVAPEVAQVGDSVALSLQVSNTGNGPATRVLLRAQLPEGLRHQAGAYIEAEIGTLGAGQTRSVVLQMQAVRPGSYVPQLTVLAEECPPSTVQVAVLVAEPALEAHVSGPGRALADQEIEYRLEASNTGTAPATGLRLSCGLPQGLEFVAAGSGGVLNPTARTVEWNPGTLAPGQAVAVALRVRARSAGEWVLPVFVQGDRQTVARASTPIRIDGMPGLTVEVVDQDDPIEVGAETTYTVRVRNQGSGPCTNLALAATVPAGMVPVRAEGPSAYVVQRQEIVFAALPQLAAQADAVYRVRVQGHRPGDWRFQARVTCDQYQRPVVKEEGTHVYSD